MEEVELVCWVFLVDDSVVVEELVGVGFEVGVDEVKRVNVLLLVVSGVLLGRLRG